MTEKIRSKWQVRIATVAIFVLGFVAGMLALHAYGRWAHRRPPENRFEQMASRLQLNDDQKTKVQQIFSDTRQQLQGLRKESEPRVNDIRQQADQRMQQVLTPEQWQKFQQMRSEMRARRGRSERP
ncbi:MAG TPA: periplasmic heavy metal sensor [Pyrinomonadaceae bacterium]|nr:periplasmic heavy metal sensor [Pyrinomonadaceae bacterium]